MDMITGFIIDITAEKRGPKKNYRRFNLLTPQEENISGWVFSTTDIQDTMAGNILLTAANNNVAISLRGKLTSDEGNMRTIKVSINSKLDKCIEWAAPDVIRPHTELKTTSIRDAFLSNVACRLEAVVLDEHDQFNFIQNEKERICKTYIIGDNSGTTQILVYDDLIDNMIIGKSFIFTQIKWKKIVDKLILTTTPNTTISTTTNILDPNLDDMNETISIKLIDKEELHTKFEEIINTKAQNNCSTCKQSLTPVPHKEHLLKCNNCSKYSLFKKNDFDINVIIHIYDQNLTFHTTKGLFQQFFQQQNPQLPLTSEDLSEYFLINGPWKVTLNHFRRELTNIEKI